MRNFNILFRRPYWWGGVAILAVITALTISLMTRRGSDGSATASNESNDPPAAEVEDVTNANTARASVARQPTALAAFIRDCGRPARARERIEIEHLFELGCISQLSTVLSFLTERDSSPEIRAKLDEHRDRASAIGAGDWTSRNQTRRMQEALVSAAELMGMLTRRRADAAPEIGASVAEAQKAALSIRHEVPLVEQTNQTDTFFRKSSEALALLAGGSR